MTFLVFLYDVVQVRFPSKVPLFVVQITTINATVADKPRDAFNNNDMFSLPENLGVVAALQRCPTPRLLASIRLRRLIMVPIC